MKSCELCNVQIPDNFVNALCTPCYKKLEAENERLKTQEEEMKGLEKLKEEVPNEEYNVVQFGGETAPKIEIPQIVTDPQTDISEPNYQCNPEQPDKEQWETNLSQFRKTKNLLWHVTRGMYAHIAEFCLQRTLAHPQAAKYHWCPKVVDVGCGMGIGSNIISQNAEFVWGFDKNENSVLFAQEAFTRYKNRLYYSPQVTFDTVDIMQDTRDFLKFDVVAAIEIIEHIADHRGFLAKLIQKFDKKNVNEPTHYFISTPNRNNKHIGKTKPNNPNHVKEFTQEELVKVLNDFFGKIELMNSRGEPIGNRNDHTPLLAHCWEAKI